MKKLIIILLVACQYVSGQHVIKIPTQVAVTNTNAHVIKIPGTQSLSSKIDNWQNAGADVYVSGIPYTEWTKQYSIPDGPAAQTVAYTVLEKAHAIRQNGYIDSFKIYLYYLGASGGSTWKFKLFYWDTIVSKYRCKATRDFLPVGSGVVVDNKQTFALNPPILAEEGDIPGVYIPLKNAAYPGYDGPSTEYRQGPITKLVVGDIALNDTSSFLTDITAGAYYFLNLSCYSKRPYAVFIGDSHFGSGYTYGDGTEWHTDQESVMSSIHTPGGSPGNINLSTTYRVSTRMPTNFKYQNFGRGGNTFAITVGTKRQLSRAVLANPKIVIIHLGINDLLFTTPAKTWEEIIVNLNTIRESFPVGTEFYLDEILPSSDKTDAADLSIRQMNAHYAEYCSTYGWTLIRCHDAMGVIKPSTGEYDTLNPIYDSGDYLHLSEAGIDKLADIISSYID